MEYELEATLKNVFDSVVCCGVVRDHWLFYLGVRGRRDNGRRDLSQGTTCAAPTPADKQILTLQSLTSQPLSIWPQSTHRACLHPLT
jgi:hypothetical protein